MPDVSPNELFTRSHRLIRRAVDLHREGGPEGWVAALPALRALTLLAEAALRAQGREAGEPHAALRCWVEEGGEAAEASGPLLEALDVCRAVVDGAEAPAEDLRRRFDAAVARAPRLFTDLWRRNRRALFSPARRWAQVAAPPLAVILVAGIAGALFLAWLRRPVPEPATPPPDCRIEAAYYPGEPGEGAPLRRMEVCHLDFTWGRGRPAGGVRAEGFGARFTGTLAIPRADTFSFHLRSSGAARLEIGERVIVDRRGRPGADESTGTIYLREGRHPFRVLYRDTAGEAALRLEWTSSTEHRRVLSNELLAPR